MTRDEQEMALWRCEYVRSTMVSVENRAAEADAAVAEFRKRYSAEPAAPATVWYDEPPFAKDGNSYPCWVEGEPIIAYVYWDSFYGALQWLVEHHGSGVVALNGRRVCPIVKPQEPTT